MTAQRQQAVEKSAANHFIDGVMTPNVFAHDDQIAVEIKDSRGMDAAGSSEIALGSCADVPANPEASPRRFGAEAKDRWPEIVAG